MQECFKCGVPENKRILFDAISDDGIVQICGDCISQEKLPIIRKYDSYNYPKKEKLPVELPRNPFMGKTNSSQDDSLKDIVNRNFTENMARGEETNHGLIRNFHWTIMRARRFKHLTQKQLSEAIAIPEVAVKTLERGTVPKNSGETVRKIERYLGVYLHEKPLEEPTKETKDSHEFFSEYGKENKGELFDEISSKDLTIDDLKKMKEKREQDIFDDEDNFDDFEEEERKD